MKSLSCYKGYRGFYEIDGTTGRVKGIGYLDGFEFKEAFTFSSISELEAPYDFREKVKSLRYSLSNPYPDLTRSPFGDATRMLKPLPKE